MDARLRLRLRGAAESFLYGRMPQFYVWFAVFVLSGIALWRVMRAFFKLSS